MTAVVIVSVFLRLEGSCGLLWLWLFVLGQRSVVERLPPVVERSLRIARDPVAAATRHRIIRDLKRTPDEPPSRQSLAQLKEAWGGRAVADVDYLREVCVRGLAATAPILECGSGLTTILLGIFGRQPAWSLEQSERWARRMRAAIRWYGLEGVDVVYAPLRDYGAFEWFTVPDRLPEEIALVVCDGPVSHKRGGTPRYGVVPVLKDRFRPGTTILLDDADRPSETEALDRWRSEGLSVEAPSVQSRSFAVAVMPP